MWNDFFMVVLDAETGEQLADRKYDRASAAVDAIMKAYTHYTSKAKNVIIKMRDWDQKLVITLETSKNEYQF